MWQCPVCRHGADVLRGKPMSVMAAAEMEIRMKTAFRLNKRQRTLSIRWRDAFLSRRMTDIELFASRPALSRIQKYCDQRQLVEIGCAVQILRCDGNSREVIVLAQTSQSRFMVADVHTQGDGEVERSDLLVLDDTSAVHEKPLDFLSYARRVVVSDTTKLEDYQRTGVNWLIHAYHNRCGGEFLLMTWDLEKTLQTLSLLSYLHASGIGGHFLVVSPLSCAWNWAREVKHFVPHLSVAKMCGSM